MGKATKKTGSNVIDSNERLRKLDSLLESIDTPNEGDEITFFLDGEEIAYRGVIAEKRISNKRCTFKIEPRTRPAPKGSVRRIVFRGREFKIS